MPAVKVNLKGVHKVKANGKYYYYVGRDRARKRLTAKPGTPEFLAQYQAAIDPLASADKRAFASWVSLFRASDEFKGYAFSTQTEWTRWLDRIRDHFGSVPTRLFDRPDFRHDIKRWRDKWKATPRAADYGKQVLSRLLTFVVDQGHLTANICHEIPNLYTADRSERIWENDDTDAFLRVASVELGWAMRLAILTGLRRDDLIRLRWDSVKPFSIEVLTGKSRGKRKAVVPLTQELRTLLDGIPKRAVTILTSSKKRPWTNDGFGSSWSTAGKASGAATKGLHFHDLRGTAATNLYRAGFTLREIAEILGWGEDRIEKLIDRYVKRDEILKDRIRRLEAGK